MDHVNTGAMALSGMLINQVLVERLYRKGVLTKREARDVYEGALETLEEFEAKADATTKPQFVVARQMIELAIQAMGPVAD